MNKTKILKWLERILLIISSAAASFLILTVIYFFLQKSQWGRKANEKEALTLLNSSLVFSTYENSDIDFLSNYSEEFSIENQVKKMNEYSTHYILHSNTQTMSFHLRKQLPKQFHPYIAKTSYRILAVYRDMETDTYHCCVLDNYKRIMCDEF